MAFTNEYVPNIADESSEFLLTARKKLNLGYVPSDKWTVDRHRDMVLVRTGGGHSVESQNDDYWTFLSGKCTYRFTTKLLESYELAGKKIHIRRSIHFRAADDLTEPDTNVIQQIKSALEIYKDYGVISDFDSCEFVLTMANGEVL